MTEEIAVALAVSGKCARIYSYSCDVCSDVGFSIKKRTATSVCCSRECAGKLPKKWVPRVILNPRAKKNKLSNGRGYVLALAPKHPKANRGYVLEHRLAMESSIGRVLNAFESVHHKNGLRNDNRIENLELWVRPQPYGQRVDDLVAWVLDNYNSEIRAKIEIQDLVRSVIARVSELA